MTTKPRANKFRIKRSGTPRTVDKTPAAEHQETPPEAGKNVVRRPVPLKMDQNAGAAPKTSPETTSGQVSSPKEIAGAKTIDAIRQEGLTGRQLRMARRVAQKNGIAATSDFEAVKLLREKGIDPFQTGNALELVSQNTQPGTGRVQLPQTVQQQPKVPSTQIVSPEERANSILKIQRDIARRRRQRMFLLFARLAVFVGLPTLLLGYYFAVIASPLYSTKSAFLIQQNESGGGPGGGLGGLFSSNQLATVQDSIAVQGYLTSREAMLRLDEEHGFRAHFENPDLDAITRLPVDASNEEAYKIFKRNVKIGYDPTEGIVNMEVIAATPEASQLFSNTLISYAEGQVSDLSLRLRNDQMRGARESFADAEQKRQEAAVTLVELQTELGEIDATGVIASAQTRIAGFETQLEEKRLELQAQLANRRPSQARVDGLQAEIRLLEASIAEQRSRLLETQDGSASLASIQAQIQLAQLDLQTRELMLQAAVEALESSRIAADRQVRYIAISTPPTAPDTASYPRVFESTFIAFLIFGGIYLMISLTASILREQVAS